MTRRARVQSVSLQSSARSLRGPSPFSSPFSRGAEEVEGFAEAEAVAVGADLGARGGAGDGGDERQLWAATGSARAARLLHRGSSCRAGADAARRSTPRACRAQRARGAARVPSRRSPRARSRRRGAADRSRGAAPCRRGSAAARTPDRCATAATVHRATRRGVAARRPSARTSREEPQQQVVVLGPAAIAIAERRTTSRRSIQVGWGRGHSTKRSRRTACGVSMLRSQRS